METIKKRILVVDDVPDWQAQLQAILRNDYEVRAVDNFNDALSIIQNREVELVIVDLRLSASDENDRQGMALLKHMAQSRVNGIVLTGYPEQQLQEEAEEKYQVFDFLDKGTLARNFQKLRDVVNEAFNLLEDKASLKAKAIQAARSSLPVSFNDDLSSWPIRKSRK